MGDSSDMPQHGGGDAASDEIVEPVEGASEVTISAVDINFEPATLQLTAGDPVNLTITNDGDTVHDFTLKAASVHVNVAPGETKTTSVTIDKAGSYQAECTVAGHSEAGMTVDVTVS